jgi:1-acyl-sn-glycerol-3-phosphate acyltransferase
MILIKYFKLAAAFTEAFFTAWFQFPHYNREQKLLAMQSWAKKILSLLNIEVQPLAHETSIEATDLPSLLVANHVSWLDILVIQSIHPSIFVAKREVGSWPVVGALAKACGVIFVDRSSAGAAREMVKDVADALQRGYSVAGFPEGTSSNGRSVQLFHANLFEAALLRDCLVQPLAIRYQDPDTHTICDEAAFIDDLGFLESLHQVMKKKHIVTHVRIERRLPPTGHSRRTLAHLSYQSVVTALSSLTAQAGSAN